MVDLSIDDYLSCEIPAARAAAELLLSNLAGAHPADIVLVTLFEDGHPVWGSVGVDNAIPGLLVWSRDAAGNISHNLSSDGVRRIRESMLDPTRELIARLGFGPRPEGAIDRTEQFPALADQFAADDERAAYRTAFEALARRCRLTPQERADLLAQFPPTIDIE